MAINDKSVPLAIKRLRMTTNFVLLCLLSLAIAEFSIISQQFNDINDNFNLIQQSYARISEVQRIAYDIRSLILIEEGYFNSTNYTAEGNLKEELKDDIENALNNLYDL